MDSWQMFLTTVCLLLALFAAPSETFDPDYTYINRLNQFMEASFNTVLSLNPASPSRSIEEDVTFWCANRPHPEYTQTYVGDKELSKKLDKTLPTAFITHGWFDNVNRSWVKSTVEAYLENLDANICAVDWSRLALQEYNFAANNTRSVGQYLGKFVEYLERNGFALDNVTLIGHSMGAHISAYAGSYLRGQVGMLVALDPAGPGFTKITPQPEKNRLDPSDAKFVQVLHTDKNFIGSQIPLGHQDFYPNDGSSPQPGCLVPATQGGIHFNPSLCSHFKAVELFRTSLSRDVSLVGYRCSLGYVGFTLGLCANNLSATFGIYTNKSVRGKFYFRTTRVPPFAPPIAGQAP